MTPDHGHLIVKLDNPREQALRDMWAELDTGRLVLDPAQMGLRGSRQFRIDGHRSILIA